MQLQHQGYPFEIKSLTETGSFEGLAAVYGNIDLGYDVIEPGAFKEFALTKDGAIRILDGHQTRSPIGKGVLVDSHVGLVMKGQLNLKVSRSRDVYELMKDGVIDGLSVGFDILPGGAEYAESGVRMLKALKLWEVSTTPFPMNQSAQVSAVKSIQKCNSIRDLEDTLREATGLSRAQAKLHAGAIWKTLSGQRDADGQVGDEAKSLLQAISNLPLKLA